MPARGRRLRGAARRASPMVVLAALLALAHPAAAQVTSKLYERFRLYSECNPMGLVVERLHSDAAEIGLTKGALQAAAESRLRAARLYSPHSDRSEYLYINVNVTGRAFSIALEYNKTLYDVHSRLFRSASSWTHGITGTHGRDAGYIVSNLAGLLDQFMVEFLRVNESACAER